MVYKSRKRLGREKVAFGDGAIMAAATLSAAGMTTAATAIAAKQQADATRAAADAQAKSIADSAKINAQSIQQQNDINTQNINNQIENQKQTIESQNQIFQDMNMNLALQAGKQNTDERKEQSKIVVKYGGKLSKRKKLAYGGIDPNSGLIMEDKGYSIPLGDSLSLLQGGSPMQPQQQTHDNSHYNPITGNNNTGMFFTTPEGKKIEAEAGIVGTDKPGEIYDKENNMIFSQRHFLKYGYSPVEKILAGVPKEQVAFEQELTKAQKGLGDYDKAKYGKKLNYGGRIKSKYGDLPWLDPKYTSQNVTVNDIGTPTYRITTNSTTTSPQSTSKGSFWNSSVGSSIISGGVNLLAQGLGFLGNNIAGNYQRHANDYANSLLTQARNQSRDVMVDAYNRMHGVDIDSVLNNGDFQAAHAIANVRAGRYNINPQLTEVERDLLREQDQINRSTNSSAARNKLLARVTQNAQDARSKLYGEQANRVEAINQGNIAELNKMANANADRDTQMLSLKGNLRNSLLQYNNDIENAKIQGIAQAQSDAILGNAQSTGQTAINNAGIRGSVISNGLAGVGAGIGQGFKTWYDINQQNRTDANKFLISAASSPNPSSVDIILESLNNPQLRRKLINAFNS